MLPAGSSVACVLKRLLRRTLCDEEVVSAVLPSAGVAGMLAEMTRLMMLLMKHLMMPSVLGEESSSPSRSWRAALAASCCLLVECDASLATELPGVMMTAAAASVASAARLAIIQGSAPEGVLS